jgi:hypothetical protein
MKYTVYSLAPGAPEALGVPSSPSGTDGKRKVRRK